MYVAVRAQTTQQKYRLVLRCNKWSIVRLKLGNGCLATNHPQGHRFYLNKTIKWGVRPASVGPRESVKTRSSLLCWRRSDDETHLICSCISGSNQALNQQFLLGGFIYAYVFCIDRHMGQGGTDRSEVGNSEIWQSCSSLGTLKMLYKWFFKSLAQPFKKPIF